MPIGIFTIVGVCALFLTWYNIVMSFKKRILIGLPIAIAFYFIILSFMWAVNVEDSYFQKLPEALVTFGTLMLAFAAFWSIKSRNEQEQQRRKDEAERENRDRNERWLNEIIQWATDVITATTVGDIRIISLEGKQLVGGLYATVCPLESKSHYIKHLASTFDNSLEDATQKTCSKLESYISSLKDAIVAESAEFKNVLEEAIRHGNSLSKLATKVIDNASNIKISDISRLTNDENISSEDKTLSNKALTLTDVEEHLKEQDVLLKRGVYFAGYIFGATLFFLATAGLAGKYILKAELYNVIFWCLLLLGGISLMGYAWFLHRRTKK